MAGDFNAKSPLWGSRVENERGTDITLTSPGIGDRLTGWKVLTEIENLRDHHYITFGLAASHRAAPVAAHQQGGGRIRWKVDEEALKAVEAEMAVARFDGAIDDPAKCVGDI
jgi:hypothetical protein